MGLNGSPFPIDPESVPSVVSSRFGIQFRFGIVQSAQVITEAINGEFIQLLFMVRSFK